MPCSDSRDDTLLPKANAKVRNLTRLLCYLCTDLEKSNPELIRSNSTLDAWWMIHQEVDREFDRIEKIVNSGGYHRLSELDRKLYQYRRDSE